MIRGAKWALNPDARWRQMSANDSERHERTDKKKRAGSRDPAAQVTPTNRRSRHPVGPENVLRDGSGEPVVSGHNSSGVSAQTRHAMY